MDLVMNTLGLVQDDTHLLPSPRDVEFYRDHGWWISGRIFSDNELESAVAGSERFYAGEWDAPLPKGAPGWGWTAADGNCLRKNDHASLQIRALAQLVRKPILAEIAARLSGADTIRLWHDQLLLKPASGSGPTNVGWHTDRSYWQTCSSQDMLTAWIPFQDIDETVGPVQMMDGSHRFDAHSEELSFFAQDLDRLESLIESGGKSKLKVPMLMGRGQVSFHHCLTLHGSGPNLSAKPRRSLAVHLQPGDNRFVRKTLPDGRVASHGIDSLVRGRADGSPDYSDSAICPQLWPLT